MFALMIALVAQGQAMALKAAEPPKPGAVVMTNQQQFDAASTAAAEGHCAEAVSAFQALQAAPTYKRNALFAAALDVRNGGCLIRVGRAAEGKAAISRGIPVLAARGAEFENDLSIARLALGDEATQRLDYTEAAHWYRAAADTVKGAGRINPLMRLSQVTMFDRDGRAIAAADEARQIAAATPGFGKKDIAVVQSQYARVLLNEGRPAEAYRVLKDSLAKQGGLTSRVGLDAITTRSDLAIAALQDKRPDDARLYLAYTGAGRMKDTPFNRAAVMNAPTCGEGGISPEDMAIVEFSLENDGRVTGVNPIYATGGRRSALAFANAVRDWSWRAEDASKVPALFRYATRVELRCSKAATGKTIMTPLSEATEAWLDGQADQPVWTDLSDAAALPLQRTALQKAKARNDAAGTAQAAFALARNAVTPSEETATLLEDAAKAARSAGAPATVRNFIAMHQLSAFSGSVDSIRDKLRALLANTDVATDPLSADTLRLVISQPAGKAPPPSDASALQSAVANDPALPANHPLKVAALLGQANVLAANGDLSGARAAFDRTGMTGEQCAQLGLSPNMRSSGASASDYPMAAARMGFEGWVTAEADVTPDGRTTIQRTTISYPPFVFDDAAIGIARDARFSSSFRPDGTLACQGVRLPMRFLLPG
jgi:TonB family protein